jgi:hypothetical protein
MEGPIPACQGAISTSFVGILPGIKCYAWLLMGTLGLNRTPMNKCFFTAVSEDGPENAGEQGELF